MHYNVRSLHVECYFTTFLILSQKHTGTSCILPQSTITELKPKPTYFIYYNRSFQKWVFPGDEIHWWGQPNSKQPTENTQVAQLSQRDRTTGWVSFGQKWKTERGDNILQTLYVHLQLLWRNWPAKLSNSVKNAKYGLLYHSRSSRSVSIESLYATSH